MINTEKRCSMCRKILPLTEFWRNKSAKDGLQNSCKTCHGASTRRSLAKHDITERNRWVRYRIKPETFNKLFAGQGSKCALCGATESGSRGNSWNVDHDHSCCPGDKTCGKCIRGIICSRCNTRLGWLEGLSGKEWLKNVGAYLARHGYEVPELIIHIDEIKR